jgi:hypothetical protein
MRGCELRSPQSLAQSVDPQAQLGRLRPQLFKLALVILGGRSASHPSEQLAAATDKTRVEERLLRHSCKERVGLAVEMEHLSR